MKGGGAMNMRKVDSFSFFGKSFQDNLCQLILDDRPFCDQISEVLDINFLELGYLQVFVRKIFDYREKYHVHPTYDIMATILRTGISDESEALQKQLRDYYTRIKSTSVEGTQYIKEVSLDFCKKQKLKEALFETIKLLQTSSFDEISKVINDALVLGCANDNGHDYLADFEERFTFKARNPTTTGWTEIDSITKGGLGKSELGVVIAPTGAGKSMVLAHLGATAVMQGKTVVHYTLELKDTVVGQRYDSCITGLDLSDLRKFKELVYDKISQLEGKLIIKEYPTKSASPQTIRNHLEKLKKRDVIPDMIIIDYADLLKPIKAHKERRIDLETIYEDIRAIAQEQDCPVWTASQTNRSGLNADVITMESISEAFNKCFVADFICTVSRTIEDKAANTGRMFVAKNRNGPDGIVYPAQINWASVSIDVLPDDGETLEEVKQKSLADKKAELFKKYRNNKE